MFIIILLNWFCDYSYRSVAATAAVIDPSSLSVYDGDNNNNRHTILLTLAVDVVFEEEAIIIKWKILNNNDAVSCYR